MQSWIPVHGEGGLKKMTITNNNIYFLGRSGHSTGYVITFMEWGFALRSRYTPPMDVILSINNM